MMNHVERMKAPWALVLLLTLGGLGGPSAARAGEGAAQPYSSAPGGTAQQGIAAAPAATVEAPSAKPPAKPDTAKAVPIGFPVDRRTLEILRSSPPPPTANFKGSEDLSESANAPAPSAPTTTASFQGIGFTGWDPPDNGFAAGLNHVLEAVNSEWRAYTKAGSAATAAVPFCGSGGWWAPVLPSGEGFCFDPRVVYDQFSDRWVMMAAAQDSNTQQSWYLLATSWTSDPTGSWCIWSMDARLDGSTLTSNWADYPGLGVDSQAIYLTSNQFDFAANSYHYAKVRVLTKGQLYNNTCGTVSWWDFWNLQEPGGGGPAFTVQPAHTYGSTGAEYLVSSRFPSGSSVTLWTLTNPTGTPGLIGTSVSTQSYDLPPAAEQCRNASPIDTGDIRLQSSVYRGGRLTTAHTSTCPADPSKSCLHVLQIDPTGPSATFDQFFGSWTAGWYYYYPAVAADQSGNLHIAFNRSRGNADASDGCVELRQTGKLTSESQIESSLQLHAGAEKYEDGGGNRWGDYSGIAADPQANAVWMSGEYVASTDLWSTWIAQTTFTGGPPACNTLTRSHTGSGSDPVASPGASTGCPAGQYHAGEAISLTASPASGGYVTGWTGTSNDASTALTNSMVMPDGSGATVSVHYGADVALANGIAHGDSLTSPNSQSAWQYYYMDIPGGSSNLVIDLYNLSADLDLYVRRNAKPTLGTYDCRPYFGGTASEECAFATPASGRWWIGVNNYETGTIGYSVKASWTASLVSLSFYTLAPCRLLDTRTGSPLASQATRTFAAAGACGIPAGANAVSVNVTAVAPTANGYVTLWPADLGKPATSVINFTTGAVRANNAILQLATDGTGGISAQAFLADGGTVQLVLDVTGYFAP